MLSNSVRAFGKATSLIWKQMERPVSVEGTGYGVRIIWDSLCLGGIHSVSEAVQGLSCPALVNGLGMAARSRSAWVFLVAAEARA